MHGETKNQSAQNDVWWKRRKWSATTARERMSEEEKRDVDRERGALRWWMVWAVWHGYPSDDQRWWKETHKKINTLHRNLNYKECWKCVAVCEKKGKVCALVNIVWAEIWKSGEPQQYLLNGWKLHRDIILIKTHYLHPVIVQRRCSKNYRNPFTESLQDGSILQINKQSERLNGLLWLNFDDTRGILAVNQ